MKSLDSNIGQIGSNMFTMKKGLWYLIFDTLVYLVLYLYFD